MDGKTGEEYETPTDKKDRYTLERRSLLKLSGAIAVTGAATATQSDVARASSHGYGEGGYGIGEYGSGATFSITTDRALAVGTSTATLTGSLVHLGGAESSLCQFEWRQVDDSNWTATPEQTRIETGSFDTTLDGLSDSTTYEYRAVGTSDQGDVNMGRTIQFTTAASNRGPAVDSFDVTEAGSPNPHVEITVDWEVSDADGNLDTAVVQVLDSSGSLKDATTTDITGFQAAGSDEVDVKHVDDERLHIEFTVVDTYGVAATRLDCITE